MKRVKRWRYYCEYCKKSGGSKYHMEMHEAHCTNNPNRKCGMCRHMGEEPEPIAALVKALGNGNEEGMKRLRELAVNCPSCILAAIRQSGLMNYDYDPDPEGYSITPTAETDVAWTLFQFQDEKKRFWAERRDD